MNDEHDILLEAAKEAADELFGDTSVSRSKTAKSLRDLVGHIESMLDTLRDTEGEQ